MIRHAYLEPRFVIEIPRTLDPGVLYISNEFGTAVHSCCCGCGHEVVTPLTPTDWKLTKHGSAVSLWPSVGNWNLPCRSHYVIQRNRVLAARAWTSDMIQSEIQRDKRAKAAFYQKKAPEELFQPPANQRETPSSVPVSQASWWMKLIKWIFG